MGKRENKVEVYFKEQVEEVLKGISRKWVSPGRDGVPDQIPLWAGCPGQVFVEVKTIDGVYTSGQEREHKRLRDAGALVFTVWGHAGVDVFIALAASHALPDTHKAKVYELK